MKERNLRKWYLDEFKSAPDITKENNITSAKVYYWLKKYGIDRRPFGSRTRSEIYKDEDWLRDQYWDKKKSCGKIAETVGVSRSLIRDWMIKYNILRRSKSEAQMGEKNHQWSGVVRCICNNCGKEFYKQPSEVNRGEGKYCSPKCWYSVNNGENHYNWNSVTKICIECGETFMVCKSAENKRRFCSEKCFYKYNGISSIEKIIKVWLLDVGISFEREYRIDFLGTYTYVDFFVKPNICIYCDGDYWHGADFPDQLKRDERQNRELEKLGYEVIRLSGSEIRDGKRPTTVLGNEGIG